MSDLTSKAISLLVQQQLEQISDPIVIGALSSLLVTPTCHDRQWDYGPEKLPCWSVAADQKFDTLYIYCEYGFGPSAPWGIVSISGNEMGMDSSWSVSLEKSFYESRASNPLPIWSVIKRGVYEEERVIATDLTDDEAWDLLGKLDSQPDLPESIRSFQIYAVEPRTQKWF